MLDEGVDVRIFTARVGPRVVVHGVESDPAEEARKHIEAWCLAHIGKVLPVTATKDLHCIEIWDDRAVQVVPNLGERADQYWTHIPSNKYIRKESLVVGPIDDLMDYFSDILAKEPKKAGEFVAVKSLPIKDQLDTIASNGKPVYGCVKFVRVKRVSQDGVDFESYCQHVLIQ
jgi:hypothetical protein